METMNCNNRASTLPLFLAGLGTGVALTLLLAPMSGAATRKLIRRRVQDGGGWVKDKAEAAGDYVVTQGEGLRDRVKDAADAITRS